MELATVSSNGLMLDVGVLDDALDFIVIFFAYNLEVRGDFGDVGESAWGFL
jgi:hypothetical protein